MSAQVLRFLPAYRALASALESKSYGTVRSALFRRRCSAPGWSGWLADPALSGGGVFDLLIHDVDICLHIFGMPEAVSAIGYEDLPNGVDIITATLHYSNAPSVTITGGWHHPKAYPFSMEYTVVTDGATFDYNSAREDAASIFTSAGEKQAIDLAGPDGYEAELEYFIQCCKTGAAPSLCPPEESAAAVKVALQMVEARKQNGNRLECRI
jgi:Predicted dehydrogenases and related proteins